MRTTYFRVAPVGKVIVAAEGPWDGEMYPARLGCERLGFSSVETFCSSLLALTGWSLPPAAPAARIRPATETRSAKQKFIVASTKPWTGEVYRTVPGLPHLEFTSFEELLQAVLDVSGWPLRLPVTAAAR